MGSWIFRVIGGLAALAVLVVVGGYFTFFARSHPADPDDARIIFDDLHAFTSAHNIAKVSDNAVEVYESLYFARESAPVDIYESRLDISAGQTAAHAQDRPRVYAWLVSQADNIIATEPDIRIAYAKLEQHYPESVFPPVYLLYGSFKARGFIRPFGILVGAEFFMSGNNVDKIEGWDNSNGLIVRPDALPSQLIHELAHIQQARKSPIAYLSNGTVLNWAIYEGAADFIAASITGTHTSQAAHEYLASNEQGLWCTFYQSRDMNRRTYWIDADVFGRPPGGIAGAFGYKIVEAYFEQSQDRQTAFNRLIELDDYESVYELSGFKARLKNRCG